MVNTIYTCWLALNGRERLQYEEVQVMKIVAVGSTLYNPLELFSLPFYLHA